jgi:hypothetical protein
MAERLIGTVFLGTIAICSLGAQEYDPRFDQNCYPVPPPPHCRKILSDRDVAAEVFENKISALQRGDVNRSVSVRAQSQKAIRGISQQLVKLRAAADQDFVQCLLSAGISLRQLEPGEHVAKFEGIAAARTSDPNAVAAVQEISVDLLFSRSRCTFSIGRFPQLTLSVRREPIGLEVAGAGPGLFYPASGIISIPLTLRTSIETADDRFADVEIILTTGSSQSRAGNLFLAGSRLGERGEVDLVGTALFVAGPFNGVEFGIEFKGTLTPRP